MRKYIFLLTIIIFLITKINIKTSVVSKEMASVILSDSKFLTIDKGTKEGIEEGDIVLSNNALVGIITDVNIPYNMVNFTVDRANGKYELVPLFDIKPYLRPMSSLTEEEKEKLCELCDMYEPYNDTNDYSYYGIKVVREFCVTDEKYIDTLNFRVIDWLLENHFDYRGLIEKGLALEAPEGMYKTE